MSTAGRAPAAVTSPASSEVPAASTQLFSRLIDDAAIFPPGNATLAAAVTEHRRLRATAMSQFLGPLLCAASRLTELALVLDDEAPSEPQPPALDVAVVVDAASSKIAAVVDSVHSDGRLDLQGVEIALRGEMDLGTTARRTAAALLGADLPESGAVYVEVPLARTSFEALDVLSEYDLRAKLRTGGADASAFPDEAAVAAFLDACLDRELALKCTAGLHNAVRHTGPTTGFEHHGFLNVLLATHTLIAGGAVQDAVAVLAERDGQPLADSARALTAAEASRVRRTFASYGSCSVVEPVEDLVALGLTPRPEGK